MKPVDVGNPSSTRRTADLLPGYHRTDRNVKFLASTLDQFIQQPEIERINGFLGSKLSPNYNPASDQYIPGTSKLRTDYQLEPSLIVKDVDGNISRAISYDDLINQLAYNNGNVTNLDRSFRSESYSYTPHIDWDKFINFREYYWLPTGPDTIEILGQQKSTISTYSVTDTKDKTALIFTPDGGTTNPLITLYRGMTYAFNVNSVYPFYVKTAYVDGPNSLYNKTTKNGTKVGQVIVTIDEATPDTLFYFAEGSGTGVGRFVVKSISDNTFIDVEADVVGKKSYTSANGVTFSNGMKVRFAGSVTPEEYAGKEFMVEGVGDKIVLVDYDTLQAVGYSETVEDPDFDATPFDKFPFDDFTYIPLTPDYITINRAAQDKNPWTKYNRWVHQDVIAATALANGVAASYPSLNRATRPIIEFKAGLQLFNFGSKAKIDVDLIDNRTTSAFKVVEKASSYYVDGIKLDAGQRVIFNADTDPLVKGRVYEVKIVLINDRQVINLEEVVDTEPLVNEAVWVKQGKTHGGTAWWFDGNVWVIGQQKTGLNQAPLWDLFDSDGNRYADQNIYDSSFAGTKIFGYAEGTVTDEVLGFPVAYRNVNNTGEYLFKNYFMTDTFNDFVKGQIVIKNVVDGFLKVNSAYGYTFETVWTKTATKPIPIIQYQVIESDTINVEINSINTPGYAKDLQVDVFVNDVKQIKFTDFIQTTDGPRAYITSTSKFTAGSRVLLKLYTTRLPNENGYYEPPINLTNNPLNGPIEEFTFSELSDHVKSIADYYPSFVGSFPGSSNLRDLSNLDAYGSRLVTHSNPVGFAHYFLGTTDCNLITAIRKVSDDYGQFKANLLRKITELKGAYSASQALDLALISLNANKDNVYSYNYSDMLAYGKNNITRIFTVSDPRNVNYNLSTIFDDSVLGKRAVLVYLNGTLLLRGYDYTINKLDPAIVIKAPLKRGDIITVLDYASTVGSYIPPTPTKLGLYPKFKPEIFIDNTYATPTKVIQGHDGSITVAFNDYRDEVLLEYEKRVYNNIKVEYNPELFNIDTVLPGAFRTNDYSISEVNNVIAADFLKWAGYYGVDYRTNNTLDELNSFTFNYTGTIDTLFKQNLTGYWRNIYVYFYGTDRPHVAPWEMLGFREKPEWWEGIYGPAPYTSGNAILWTDLENGRNAFTDTIDPLYVRPGLSKILPVDENGNLLSPTDSGLASTPIVNLDDPKRIVMLRNEQIATNWQVGDWGPAETAWRRSSYWPFACQVFLALAKPASYAAACFDPSRLQKNAAGQYRYGDTSRFISPSKVAFYSDVVGEENTVVDASGYSVFVIEAGLAKDSTFLERLKEDLSNLNYQLLAKLGGFASKDKLQIGIDAVDPTSAYTGALVPAEDFQIFFNKSTPIESIGVSGLIIQKTARGWTVRGYDKFKPYFTVLKPFVSNTDQIERVGGLSEPFVNWMANTTYNEGQVVFYVSRYYRVKQKHLSGTVFNSTYYQGLPYLPVVGGVGVLRRSSFTQEESIVPYGAEFYDIQEVYDLIVGYGKWLSSKGFVFEEYNNDLDQILDWNFTAKEYLYWTTQNWAVNSVITLSPFANKVVFRSNQGIVDSITNVFQEYSLLKADGSPFPKSSFTIVRLDGEFVLSTINTQEGIFFARINLVQKEHAIVLNNFTLFNDIIYDVETGYRQRRIKVKGFITKGWNGDFFSPGFVFDQAAVSDWVKFTDYSIGDVVRFSGKYYAAIKSIPGSAEFDITKWAVLNEKPTPALLPNFDYKISQFEDFYSLDIDNFDAGQQAAAQHLIGYTPRPYLNYIIGDPIAQYKFYQGYIREKGTKQPLLNIRKASQNNFRSSVDFNEEWAFRIGHYGGFNTYQELETALEYTEFLENPQIIEFTSNKPVGETDTVYYKDYNDIIIKPDEFDIEAVFKTVDTTLAENTFKMPVAGYVRFDDVDATAYNKNSVLDIANNGALRTGTTIWLGFREDGSWDVLRLADLPTYISAVDVNVPGQSLVLTTYYAHQLSVGDLISVTGLASTIDQCYIVDEIVSPNEFVVLSTLAALPSLLDPVYGLVFVFKSSRLGTFNDLANIPFLDRWSVGEKVWVDNDGTGKWAVYKRIENYSSSFVDSEGIVVTALASGNSGTNTISVSTASLSVGMLVSSTGTALNATISSINNGSVTLSGNNTVTFSDYVVSFENVGQHYGNQIITSQDSLLALIAAPDFNETNSSTDIRKGRMFVSYKNSFGTYQVLNGYSLNEKVNQYYNSALSSETKFGHSLALDGRFIDLGPEKTIRISLAVAGAPYASRVRAVYTGTNVVHGEAGAFSTKLRTGVVKVSLLDEDDRFSETEGTDTTIVLSPAIPDEFETFGWSVALSEQNTSTTRVYIQNTSTVRINSTVTGSYISTGSVLPRVAEVGSNYVLLSASQTLNTATVVNFTFTVTAYTTATTSSAIVSIYGADTRGIVAGSTVYGEYINGGAASVVSVDSDLGTVELNTAQNIFTASELTVVSTTTGFTLGTKQQLLVGAPGYGSTTTTLVGKVYVYDVEVNRTETVSSSSVVVSPKVGITTLPGHPSYPLNQGSYFGFSVSGNQTLTRVAVAAPGFIGTATSAGAVFVYDFTKFENNGVPVQVITGDDISPAMTETDIFASKVVMSKDGKFLIVSSTDAYDPAVGAKVGVVDAFIWNEDEYKFIHNQRISVPISAISSLVVFGYDIDLNDEADTLVISVRGSAKANPPTFDTYSTRSKDPVDGSIYINDVTSEKRGASTTFDGGATSFSSKIYDAGTVHVYNRLGVGTTKWAHAQQLINKDVQSYSSFGQAVVATSDTVLVGAPGLGGYNYGNGQTFVFNKIDASLNSWELSRQQEPSVDLTSVKRAITIEADGSQIRDYIDIIDPIKGRILGICAEELSYTTSYDPAIYSIGVDGVNVDPNTNWLDEHIGELWWDLSTVKYVWSEQGDLEYRKNNWNNLFPGSSIDVYEWVRSEYLPAEWASLADTAEGLTLGISGQPKFNDNGVISVKQVYNSVSNSFKNVYYYWVKNKAVAPVGIANRRKSAFDVARQIADPVGSGAKFLSIIGPNSIALANIKPSISADHLNLNISFDSIENAANKHTEWLLLQENDPNSTPNWLLEKKMFDSLLGHDSLGNAVPDPSLPKKLQYGIEVRPRQSMFVNRVEALRNVVEFSNDILKKEQITGRVSFDNLNSVDEIPDASTYDSIVEDIFTLELINTNAFLTPHLSAVLNNNGGIDSVSIDVAGFGYLTPPSITVVGDGTGARIEATINSYGNITSVNIIDPGVNYTEATIVVRPYTAVVRTDSNSSNKWAIYVWDDESKKWVKTRTQDYNTPLYWHYIDWVDSSYDQLKTLSATVASPYALEILESLSVGSYVKVNNGGDGRYLILRKTDGSAGTFDQNWDLVYSEKGTIQISESLWDESKTLFAFDEQVGWDQTLYDQAPDAEILYILNALKSDIFIADRKIYWNQLFFKLVRYAMSEQKFLDWAFKTTFISVINDAGTLNQPATYKLKDSSFYEEFLKEIKPYHTQIRKFTEQYTSLEPSRTFTTDFDVPAYYNTLTSNFSKVSFGNDLLLQYPWKSWYDNYAYNIESIEVTNGGDGYTEIPTVTIVTAPGDTGNGATAVAYISQGKVSRIIVTNPGKDYTTTPTVVISGGGSTSLSVATAYAHLGGSPVRSNLIKMKFDRVGTQRDIGQKTFSERFVVKGESLLDGTRTTTNSEITFPLAWVPVANKELITFKVNGIEQLIDSYSIVYSEKSYSPQPGTEYTKKYATLQLNFMPYPGDIIEITYPKSLDLYTAAARVLDYYQPGPGMPGVDLAQVMTGVEYSGLIVNGLLFSASGGWDLLPWASTAWDNYASEEGYTSFVVEGTSTQVFEITNLVSTGTEVNVYIKSSGDTSPSGYRIDDPNYGKIWGVASLSSLTNTVNLSQGNLSIFPGNLVQFNGTSAGNITTGTFYYVSQVISSSSFTVSRSRFGSTATLETVTSPNLVMSVNTPEAVMLPLVGKGTGAIKNIEVLVPGSGYNAQYTALAISAPNSLTGRTSTGTLVFEVVEAHVENGGANYQAGDLLVSSSAYGTSTFLVSRVSTTTAVVAITVVDGGSYIGSTPVSVQTTSTNSTGTTATLTLKYGISEIRVEPPYGNPGSGYTEPPAVTIIETINTGNQTSSVTVPAFARAVLKSEFVKFGPIPETTSSVSIPDTVFTSSSTLVIFRYSTSDGTVIPTDPDSLDAIVDGGNLAYTTARGITPTEIVLDGGSTSTRHITGMMDDGFLNPVNSYAPEECVPGQIQESIGISVYTGPGSRSPLIATKNYWADGVTRTYSMGTKPVNKESVLVYMNNRKLVTGTYPEPSEYTVDFANNTVTLSSGLGSGWLTITAMQLGTLNLVDSVTAVSTTTGNVLYSIADFTNVGSVYITLDGIPLSYLDEWSTSRSYSTGERVFYQGLVYSALRATRVGTWVSSEWELVTTPYYNTSDSNGLTKVSVNNSGTIQAYLFNGTAKSFSEVKEQVIIVSNSVYDWQLQYPPGNVGPYHSQVIVTKDGKRLKPPVTTYYEANGVDNTFDITNSTIFTPNTITIGQLEVYVNGTIIPRSRAWAYSQQKHQVTFSKSYLKKGDAVAIVIKKDYDYLILGSGSNMIMRLAELPLGETVIRITTFTNHDPDFIRTEVFKAAASNRYTMGREIFNSDYVWVTYNGTPLASNLDYTVDSNRRTVVLREGIFQSSAHDVVITSFADLIPTVGYRIFADMLGRTSYKRLSAENSTRLAQDFSLTDQIIIVEDSSVLSVPQPEHNLPGVILIEGERIEFFTVVGNVLGQLRRSTLGTGPKDVYYAGTQVLDQGAGQTIPFAERKEVYTTATLATKTSYDLSGVINFDSTDYRDRLFEDQVEVRYQGMPLLKPSTSTTVVHNFDLAYDSTSTADTIVEPGFTINTLTSVITLNTASVTIVDGGRLEVIRRISQVWYSDTDTTLALNNTAPAMFITSKPAEIPRALSTLTYVAEDLVLYVENGMPLTDESDNPLEGI